MIGKDFAAALCCSVGRREAQELEAVP